MSRHRSARAAPLALHCAPPSWRRPPSSCFCHQHTLTIRRAQSPYPQTKGVAKVKPDVQWHFVIEGLDATRAEGKDDGTFEIPGRNGDALQVYEAKMAKKQVNMGIVDPYNAK